MRIPQIICFILYVSHLYICSRFAAASLLLTKNLIFMFNTVLFIYIWINYIRIPNYSTVIKYSLWQRSIILYICRHICSNILAPVGRWPLSNTCAHSSQRVSGELHDHIIRCSWHSFSPAPHAWGWRRQVTRDGYAWPEPRYTTDHRSSATFKKKNFGWCRHTSDPTEAHIHSNIQNTPQVKWLPKNSNQKEKCSYPSC